MINPVTRAAIALRERRRAPDMAEIMSALPVPVVLLDTKNRFRFVDHAAEQFLGIPSQASRSCGCATSFPRTTRCSSWSSRCAGATPVSPTTTSRSTARG